MLKRSNAHTDTFKHPNQLGDVEAYKHLIAKSNSLGNNTSSGWVKEKTTFEWEKAQTFICKNTSFLFLLIHERTNAHTDSHTRIKMSKNYSQTRKHKHKCICSQKHTNKNTFIINTVAYNLKAQMRRRKHKCINWHKCTRTNQYKWKRL